MAILFVSGLFAVGAFILYKFKRQGLAFLGSPGMWVGPKGHRGLGLCPDGPRDREGASSGPAHWS